MVFWIFVSPSVSFKMKQRYSFIKRSALVQGNMYDISFAQYFCINPYLANIFLEGQGFLSGSDSKETNCLQCRRSGLSPWVGTILWRREWQLTPVFLSGEFHRQTSWWATVHGLAKSWTQLSDFFFSRRTHNRLWTFLPPPPRKGWDFQV